MRSSDARVGASWLLPALLASTVGAARAQEAGTALEEIVVSAQRRTENLQDVPISIQALDEKTLEKAGIRDVHDLMLHAPGVDITSAQPGNAIIIIRGLAPIGGPQTAGLYIDDIPVTGGTGGTSFSSSPEPLINDTARVEVLKGPQGTLYGESAMGGAIKFVSNKPDATAFSGKADVEGATTDSGDPSYAASATVNVPLITDKLALRTSVSYRNDGGYIDNYSPRTQTRNGENVNDYESVAARVALSYMPTDTLTITPSYLYQRGETADRSYSSSTTRGSPNPSYLTTTYLQPQQKQTFQPEDSVDRIDLFTLNIDEQFTPNLTLTSITGYYKRTTEQATDINAYVVGAFQNSAIGQGVNANLSTNYTENESRKFTQEIRLAMLDPGSRFSWTVGAFYSKDEQESSQSVLTPGLTSSLVSQYGAGTTVRSFYSYALPTDQLYSGHTEAEPEQYAFFGEVGFQVTDALKLTAGARYFELEQYSVSTNDGLFNGGPSRRPLGPAKFHGTNPRFVAEYTLTDDNMVYASATKGFRQGKLNGNVPTNLCSQDLAALGLSSAPRGSDPDSLWNYEVGSKNQLFGGRLRLNAAAYQMEWEDIQLSVFLPTCSFSFNANVGKAHVRGAELAFDAEVATDVTVGAVGNYLNAKVTEVVPNTPYRVGDELPYAPEYTYTAYLEYATTFANSVRGFARADYMWHGDAVRDASSSSTSPNFNYEGWDEASLAFGAEWDDWSARLFVRNLFNDESPIDFANFWGQWRVAYQRPRTIGLNLGKRF